jgi:hypothetical protein
MGYQTKVYRKQGGDEFVVADGGKITVESGGEIEIESGATLTIVDGGLETPDLALAEGNIAVGDSDGEGSALDASGDGKILVGNGTTITSVAVSGDATLANTGALTIATGAVEDSMLASDVARVITASGGDTMTREENVAGLSSAITLANEIRGDIINHFANSTRHTTGVQDTSGIADEATDLTSLITLATSLMSLYVDHNADMVLASGWSYHNAQGANKALESEVAPTTLAEAVTKLNDLKGKYNDHEDETVGHAGEASVTADQVAASDAAYGATNRVTVPGAAAGDLVSWAILNSGTGTVTGVSATAGTNYVDFEFSADPQDDAIISYIVMRPAS